MRISVKNAVKKIVFLSSLSGVSYFLGRKSVENCLEFVSKCYLTFGGKTNLFYQIKSQFEKLRKPGLPIFATVSAAVPSTPNQPLIISTENRIAQIMKYGFPGISYRKH